MSTRLLEVRDLRTHFFNRGTVAKAVDGVTFHVDAGEMLALVGESGCGKSVTAYSLLRLIADPPGKIVGGEILFEGRDLMKLPDDEMRRLRGDRIAMIFQDPMSSLNPVFTIGAQIAESVLVHRGGNESSRVVEGGRVARPGRHFRSAPAHRRVSAPSVRWHAPTRGHRHGAGLRTETPDRG